MQTAAKSVVIAESSWEESVSPGWTEKNPTMSSQAC